MRLRVSVVVTAACTALVLGAAAPASAGTLDQQQTSAPNNVGLTGNPPAAGNNSLAQTFTAGITGGLDQVDLSLIKVGVPPANLTVQIRSVVAGQPGPTRSTLSTLLVPPGAIGTTQGFVPVPITSPLPVVAGTQYAIVAFIPANFGNTVGWGRETADLYTRGAMSTSPDPLPPNTFVPNDGDMAFKTYVVPAPTVIGPVPGPPAKPVKCKKKKKRAKGKPKAAAAAKCKKKKKRKKR